MVVDFVVCPRCGAPMILINGQWVCRVCKYTQRTQKVKSLYSR